MKITVKTIDRREFPLDVAPEKTILEVKQELESSVSAPPERQKLIHNGRVLEDSRSLSDYGVEDNAFLIVMTTRAKKPATTAGAASTPTSTTGAPAAQQEQPAAAAATPTSTAPATRAAPAPAPTEAGTGAAATAEVQQPAGGDAGAAATTEDVATASSRLAMGEERQRIVQNIVDMGFNRADVERAMIAAFNNPDRAVEYLMSGIPEVPAAPAAPAPPAAPAAQTGAEPAAASPTDAGDDVGDSAPGQETAPQGVANPFAVPAAPPSGAAGGVSNIDLVLQTLRNNPEFSQLRLLVQNHPEMLQPVLQSVTQANPAMLQFISQHPNEFRALMNEPVQASNLGGQDPATVLEGIRERMMGGGGGGGVQTIQITQEDQSAIQRLVELGFDEQVALQAYIACDKNEELAANYLFDHGHEMMQDAENDQSNE